MTCYFSQDNHYWRYVSPLPVALTGLRGVTIHNTMFMTGGHNYNDGSVSRKVNILTSFTQFW